MKDTEADFQGMKYYVHVNGFHDATFATLAEAMVHVTGKAYDSKTEHVMLETRESWLKGGDLSET